MEGKMTASEAADFLGISLQGVHKKLKEKGLEYQKSAHRVFFKHKTARTLFNIKYQHKIIAFQNVKGGGGKTSLTHCIGVRASLYGARVLCIDLDQQGNLTEAFGIDAEEKPTIIDILKEGISIEDCIINIADGLDLIPGRVENAILDNEIMVNNHSINHVYKNLLKPLKKKYDFILIDCPPALGQSVAAIVLAVDEIIVPVAPESYSLSGLKTLNNAIKNLEKNFDCKRPLKIVVNKHDSRTYLSHKMLGTLHQSPIYNQNVCETYVRSSQEIPNSVDQKVTIFDTLKVTTAKEDIDLLTRELLSLGNNKNTSGDIYLGDLEAVLT